MKLIPAIFLILLTLKLCNVLTWSWWWITSPLWGGFLGAWIIGTIIALVTPESKVPWQFRK